MNLLDQVKAAQSALKDQTAEAPSYERELPAQGRAYARFVSYVEIGKRPQKPYQGKPKPPAHEVRLGFELVGKKHAREIEVDGVKTTIQPVVHTKVAVKAGDRASFVKLLKKMAYGRDGITHMALMLGEGFIVTVKHNESGEGDQKRTYVNIRDEDGNWLLESPMVRANPNDPEDDSMVPAAVPPATTPLQLLLWDAPTKEQWDSIFIDGTREVKDEKGNTKQVSKNWMQEEAQKATDFEGSALHALLLELAASVPLDGGQAKAKSAAQKPAEADPLDDALGMPAKKTKAAPEADAGDPLAALGFDNL